jgi:hypothetical protein
MWKHEIISERVVWDRLYETGISDKFHFVKRFFNLLAFNNHHATEPEVVSVT